MPYSGGVYTAPSLPGSWNPAVDDQAATSTDWNTLLDDIETALSTCVLKNGSQIITANIPMATFKFTGLGAGSAATDSVNLSQIQSSTGQAATVVGGTANAISLTMSPTLTALTNGLTIRFVATASNTLPSPTLNAGFGGAKTITWPDQSPLLAADIITSGMHEVAYNSTTDTWHLMSVSKPLTQNIASAKGDILLRTGAGVVGKLTVGANGTIPYADSVQTAGLRYIAALNSVIYGLTYQNNAGDATNDLDIAAGGAMDATGAYWMTGSALTKQSDAVWAVGNNAGMLDTGAVGNSDYYLWVIARSDTGVVDYLCSLSSTAPTMPTNYDFKRLIGWFKRTGGTIVAFKTYEGAGGSLDFLWSSPTLDVNLANTLTTSRRTDAVKVPLNISTDALLNIGATDASTTAIIWVCCPDQTDLAPGGGASTAPLGTLTVATTGDLSYTQARIKTSSTGTIASRASLATVDQYGVSTLGFSWSRRP